MEVLLPAWREHNVDVEVLTPGKRPDRAFQDKVVEHGSKTATMNMRSRIALRGNKSGIVY